MTESFVVDPPLINPENKGFWEAANQGTLLLKQCQECHCFHWYPRALCPYCGSSRTQWTASSGRGVIYSYSMVSGPVPVVAAYVTLDEGVTMLTQLVTQDAKAIGIGQPVAVTFVKGLGGQSVPVFQPATER